MCLQSTRLLISRSDAKCNWWKKGVSWSRLFFRGGKGWGGLPGSWLFSVKYTISLKHGKERCRVSTFGASSLPSRFGVFCTPGLGLHVCPIMSSVHDHDKIDNNRVVKCDVIILHIFTCKAQNHNATMCAKFQVAGSPESKDGAIQSSILNSLILLRFQMEWTITK